MHSSLSRSNLLVTAFIWFCGYLFIDLCVIYHVIAIVNYIVDGYYLHELVSYFGLAIYRMEVKQYYPAIQSLFYVVGIVLFIMWELHDNPAVRNDEKYMSRSLRQVLKDTCVHIIWTYIGLIIFALIYHLVNIVAFGTV